MSVGTEQTGFLRLNLAVYRGQNDSYGLPVSHSSSRKPTEGKPANQKPAFSSGLRVPGLKDIEHKHQAPTSCRFDVIETVKTVVKPGEYGPRDTAQSAYASRQSRQNCEQLNTTTMDTVQHRFPMSRQPTFHSTAVRHLEKGVKDMWDKISPYHWDKRHITGNEHDARDVLYRNTYCLDQERLRYTRSTLPRISQERPWTISDTHEWKKMSKSVGSDGNSKIVTIIPQQPRGTVVRFREYMRPVTYGSSGRVLDVKRVSNHTGQATFSQASTLRSIFPVIRNDSKKGKKGERPMKFENSRYKANRGISNNKPVNRVPPSAVLQREYHSADTFNEYVESLQQDAVNPQSPTREIRTRQESRGSQTYDYHNQALRSVVKVNQPAPEDGRGAPPATEESSMCDGMNRSKSAITIEIKSSWQEGVDTDKDTDIGEQVELQDIGVVYDLEEVDRVSLPGSDRKSAGSSARDSQGAVNAIQSLAGSGNIRVTQAVGGEDRDDLDGSVSRPNTGNSELITGSDNNSMAPPTIAGHDGGIKTTDDLDHLNEEVDLPLPITENDDGTVVNEDDTMARPLSRSDGGTICPTNTPTPDCEDQQIEL